MKKLSHKNIANFVGFKCTPSELILFMQLYDASLEEMLRIKQTQTVWFGSKKLQVTQYLLLLKNTGLFFPINKWIGVSSFQPDCSS